MPDSEPGHQEEDQDQGFIGPAVWVVYIHIGLPCLIYSAMSESMPVTLNVLNMSFVGSASMSIITYCPPYWVTAGDRIPDGLKGEWAARGNRLHIHAILYGVCQARVVFFCDIFCNYVQKNGNAVILFSNLLVGRVLFGGS